MSHFAGYLRTNEAASADETPIEQALLGAMARQPERALHQHREGRLWVVTQELGLWRGQSADRHAHGLAVVVGDPILVAADSGDADAARSAQALGEALVSGHWDTLQTTRGSFAALGWHAGDGRLLLATDKIGSRPLYVKRERQRWLFATSIALLRLLQADPEQVDEQGLAETLFFGQPLGDRTAFAGVRVLRPGCALRINAQGSEDTLAYFDLATVAPQHLSYDEGLAALHATFRRAVQRRLRGDAQEAFLSGGLDSRAVVAELIDQGRRVHSFCAAYPDSLDDIVGRQIAQVLGTEHQTWHRSPADRVRVALDPFAVYARAHFRSPVAAAGAARGIWSGDGGSVTLGHVYLKPETVQRAAGRLDADLIRQLFPGLNTRPSRQLGTARLRRWTELAIDGALQAFARTEAAAPERRLFLFYMQNDQARHLYHHFERIAESGIELITPFFDSDFVSLVSGLPIDWFLRHRLYNDWIAGFGCAAGSVYWQPYRGHLPGPHAKPSTIADQWDAGWYRSPEVRRTYREIGEAILRRPDDLASPFLDRQQLRLSLWMNRLGVGNRDYELAYARNLVSTLARP